MSGTINKGDKVRWAWGNVEVLGEVIDMYIPNRINIYGNSNTERLVEQGAKALLIELEDGRKVLKLESEVRRAR